MEPIGSPSDWFRELLTHKHIERICIRHDLPKPQKVVAEERGNEKVIYHLDDHLLLAFSLSDDIHANVGTLTILEHIEAMPTPRVIAWTEEDPELQVPYMIVERCPGIRLDILWKVTGFHQRVKFLEALGAAMGRYHTVGSADVTEVANQLSLSDLVSEEDLFDSVYGKAGPSFDWERVTVHLSRTGLQTSPTIELLKAHYAQRPQRPEEHFIGSGLVHGEPWAEHFFLDESQGIFRLSGCVDLESVLIADSLHEIVTLYVSMLALEPEYYQSFKRGYERFFAFPADAEERLRYAAIDFDMDAVRWLLAQMESRPNAWGSWAIPWVTGHWCRLLGWLDPSKGIHRALFRIDIGPF
jgi:aminoglycoside phosphotransferase (APT) family kinase protein